MSELLKKLNWRYATKKFDPSKIISADDLEELVSVMNLAPSSYGLQPYEILVIKNEKIRKQLREVSWNQSQITDASHLIVICNRTNLAEKDVDDFLENISRTRNIPLEGLANYAAMMKNTVNSTPPDQLSVWTSRQTYIVLGTLLTACAVKDIDACPMEGFDKAGYDKILNLSSRGLEAAVIAAVGYRSEDDSYQHLKKVRKNKDDLITYI